MLLTPLSRDEETPRQMSESDRSETEAQAAPPTVAPGAAERVEAAVVGGGLAGLICAWRAARSGAGVVVIDDPRRPAAAHVAAGMIAPVGEASWGEEELLGAGLRSAAEWPAFAAELEADAGLPVPYRRCGALHVALDPDEAAELRRRGELERRLGLEARELLGSECRALEPGLASVVNAGIEAPGEAEVDPRRLLEALRAACAANGVRFIDGTVSLVDPRSGRIEGGGFAPLTAERVFLAAGAWAGAEGLLGRDRPRLPVRPVKGEIVRLRAEAGAMPCERIIGGERFYIVPRAEGEIVIGATVEERGFDLRVTAGGVHELLREAYRALPELAELELIETAAGLRPGSPDNAPAIGPLPGDDERRVIVVAGLYRNGVLLAPMIAAAADNALQVAELPAELAALTPDRLGRRHREQVRA